MARTEQGRDVNIRARQTDYAWLTAFLLIGLVASILVAYAGLTGPGFLTVPQAFAAVAVALGVLTLAVIVLLLTVGRTLTRMRDYVFAMAHVQDRVSRLDEEQNATLAAQRDQLEQLRSLNALAQRTRDAETQASQVAHGRFEALEQRLSELDAFVHRHLEQDAHTPGAFIRNGATPMALPVDEIEGIGERFAQRLGSIGIQTIGDLRDADPTQVARQAQTSEETARTWRSMATLMQVDGVDAQASELLVRSGYRGVEELAESDPQEVVQRIEDTRRASKVTIAPTRVDMDVAQRWVGSARAALTATRIAR